MEASLKVNENSPVCRVCLTEEGEFQSVFVSDEPSGLTIHLAEMIMAYTSVQITLGDGLPEQVCSICAKKVVHMYLFKRQCEESDATLREHLGKLTDKMCTITEEQRIAAEALNIDPYTLDVVIKPEVGTENDETSLSSSHLEDGFVITLGSCEHESDAEEHRDSKQELNSATCGVCLKTYCDLRELNKHMKTHLGKEFTCKFCSVSFAQKDLFLSHQATHEIKAEVTTFENVLNEEVVGENSEDKFDPSDLKCVPCSIEFLDKAEFVKHITTHSSQINVNKSLVCQVCNKSFSKSSHLIRHLKIHVKANICKLCNKGFARNEQLVNHMNVHSGVKPHVCSICNKGFNQVSNLRDHLRTHNGEKPFLCSTCGKGFNQLGNLRQHIVRHSGVKAHLCSTCGNGFASKGELCAHVRKHTGARPFVCPICSHGFTTSSSLTKHKRIHSGEKPYECEVCKMKFSRSGILARHKRTHTGEKPYVCKYCSKAFSQSNDLSSHLRIHTGEKPYICDTCGQPFRQSSALKSHKKTHVDRSSIFDIERPRNLVPIARNNFINAVP